ncbi:MAG: Carboxy-terminal domain (CTD) phosphatase [Caeruleum heppii]|nr:MAG: Carboxy-terminal domain (CTD) phosphatase [Caeruleum heppii]
MRLQLPRSLHYPITVTELLRQPNEQLERSTPLFSYSYNTTVTEGNRFGDEIERQKTFPARYESPVEGVLKEWRVQEGTVISSSQLDVAEIEEPCTHAVQFGGMCTLCGKDMTEISYNADLSNADRATINMIHDNNALRISQDVCPLLASPSDTGTLLMVLQEATRVEEEAKRRLIKSKKLSLVVDLDQTIIHATVDPTVGEWQQDESNPNHPAVKDVRAFQLIDDGPIGRGCWYYIKLRPGLKDFLDNISQLYELHIYTMGTRAYAQHIAKIVDPDRKIFGDRILSRDESGSLTAKNLQRLFPVDTKMVVIIDDRADVWKWSENLIKVTPYDFFVGIGDINSSFLPKKPELTGPKTLAMAAPKPNQDRSEGATKQQPEPIVDETDDQINGTQESQVSSASTVGSDVSALEQLVSMGGGDDPAVLEHQASEQAEAVTVQLEERPLLQKQRILDAEDDAAAASAETSDQGQEGESSNGVEKSEDGGPVRHNLLRDDDTELEYLERSLRDVHRTFFEKYSRTLATAPSNRIAALRGDKGAKKMPVQDDDAELLALPDIKTIMPMMKAKVLEGVNIVLSGVVPLGTDAQRSDIVLWARSFGAEISENISKRTTHLVAARNRTAKVRQAARTQRIKIVTTQWLLDSISQWKRLDENPYLIPVHPDDQKPPSSGRSTTGEKEGLDIIEIDNEMILSASEEENNDLDEEPATLEKETEDVDGVMPEDLDDSLSPVDGFEGYDWKGAEEELRDFLGSDDEAESDSESATSEVSDSTNTRDRKRGRSPSSEAVSLNNGTAEGKGRPKEDSNGPRLPKRQRTVASRVSKSIESGPPQPPAADLPSSQATMEEVALNDDDDVGGGDQGRQSGYTSDSRDTGPRAADDVDEEELDRELAAEMEKEFSNDEEADEIGDEGS